MIDIADIINISKIIVCFLLIMFSTLLIAELTTTYAYTDSNLDSGAITEEKPLEEKPLEEKPLEEKPLEDKPLEDNLLSCFDKCKIEGLTDEECKRICEWKTEEVIIGEQIAQEESPTVVSEPTRVLEYSCYDDCVRSGRSEEECKSKCEGTAAKTSCYEECGMKGYSGEECRKICYEAEYKSYESDQDLCFRKCSEMGLQDEECKSKCYRIEEMIESAQEKEEAPLEDCVKRCIDSGGDYDECKEKCYGTFKPTEEIVSAKIVSNEECVNECLGFNIDSARCEEKCSGIDRIDPEKATSILEKAGSCYNECLSTGMDENNCQLKCLYKLGQTEEVKEMIKISGLSVGDCINICVSSGMSTEDCEPKCKMIAKGEEKELTAFGDKITNDCKLSCIEKGMEEEGCDKVCGGMEDPNTARDECYIICEKEGFTDEECKGKCYRFAKEIENIGGCVGGCIAAGENEERCAESCSFDPTKISEIKDKRINIIMKKNITESAIAVNEKRETIQISVGEIEFKKVEGIQRVEIPMKLRQNETLRNFSDVSSGIEIEGDKIRFKMKDESGAVLAIIEADTEITGTGEKAVIKMEKIKLRTEDSTVNIKSGTIKSKPRVSISANLKEVPSEGIIEIKDANLTDEEVKRKLAKFEEMARENNLTIKAKGVVIEIEKENMGDLVENTTITMNVDKDWVEENGGKDNVRIMKQSDETYELLKTNYLKTEGDNYVFEGEGSGLSLYAMVTVQYMAPEEGEEKLPIHLVLGGIIIIIITAALTIAFLGKKSKSGKKK